MNTCIREDKHSKLETSSNEKYNLNLEKNDKKRDKCVISYSKNDQNDPSFFKDGGHEKKKKTREKMRLGFQEK